MTFRVCLAVLIPAFFLSAQQADAKSFSRSGLKAALSSKLDSIKVGEKAKNYRRNLQVDDDEPNGIVVGPWHFRRHLPGKYIPSVRYPSQ